MAIHGDGREGAAGDALQGVALAVHVGQCRAQIGPAGLQFDHLRIGLCRECLQLFVDGWQQQAFVLAEVGVGLLAGDLEGAQVGAAEVLHAEVFDLRRQLALALGAG